MGQSLAHCHQAASRDVFGLFIFVCVLVLLCSRFTIPSSHHEVKMRGKAILPPLNFLRQ